MKVVDFSAICSPSCQHGAACINVNTCNCTAGYNGSVCELRKCCKSSCFQCNSFISAICPLACQNGGVCVSFGYDYVLLSYCRVLLDGTVELYMSSKLY